MLPWQVGTCLLQSPSEEHVSAPVPLRVYPSPQVKRHREWKLKFPRGCEQFMERGWGEEGRASHWTTAGEIRVTNSAINVCPYYWNGCCNVMMVCPSLCSHLDRWVTLGSRALMSYIALWQLLAASNRHCIRGGTGSCNWRGSKDGCSLSSQSEVSPAEGIHVLCIAIKYKMNVIMDINFKAKRRGGIWAQYSNN